MKSKIIKINSEIGAGTRGSSLGIAALNNVAFQRKEAIFEDRTVIEIDNENHHLYHNSRTPHAKYIEFYQNVFQRIAQKVSQAAHKGERLMILSGDHANAAAVVTGIRQANPKGKLGILWIDAHADLHSPYTTPSGNIHGMPLGLILGLDNKSRQRNTPSLKTQKIWDQLKSGAADSPTPKVAYIAVRDYEAEESAIMKELQLPKVDVDELKTKAKIEERVEVIKWYFEDCEEVYISFDVDSMDSETVSNGTGTPVPNGLSLPQTKLLIATLLEEIEKIKYFEITEINPLLDTFGNKMAEAAYEVFQIVANSFDNQPLTHNARAVNGSKAV